VGLGRYLLSVVVETCNSYACHSMGFWTRHKTHAAAGLLTVMLRHYLFTLTGVHGANVQQAHLTQVPAVA
jgi:hypothetical protein